MSRRSTTERPPTVSRSTSSLKRLPSQASHVVVTGSMKARSL
ncbi:hypothetical protein SMD44_07258 [Streptomyces alboflavus]|uniref:Uncharacterized protein n=1 Tax=Streptomyces alboflavus TaxID=67267 RepID=A0A1Z1WMV1_9ACTN|nr:hypothetical protein SMD44_07258 [Streptomyces alboflavus]